MSVNFSGEQYENAFIPHRLQNWQIPSKYPPKRPGARSGFTQAVGTTNGYVLPGVKRGNNSPWGNFVGTWDAPLHIPGPRQTVPTARTAEAARKLVAQKEEANYILSGHEKSLKDRHPLAPADLPECYPRADQKKLLKAAACRRPPEGDNDANRREQQFSNQFATYPDGKLEGFDNYATGGHAGDEPNFPAEDGIAN